MTDRKQLSNTPPTQTGCGIKNHEFNWKEVYKGITELNQHFKAKTDKNVQVTQCVLKAGLLLETAKALTSSMYNEQKLGTETKPELKQTFFGASSFDPVDQPLGQVTPVYDYEKED